MAGIDTGAQTGGKRDVNRDLPLLPFIDFLLCLVAFLLVTAVWTQSARLEADARVPGDQTRTGGEREQELHVKMRPNTFKLEWRQANTVLNMTDVPRKAVMVDGQPSYPDLARVVGAEYASHGVHRNPTDPKPDLAVLHADNATSYGELIAVMDAVYATTKQGTSTTTPTRRAFNVAFAVD
jgi:biopolymer transport protein ExbD